MSLPHACEIHALHMLYVGRTKLSKRRTKDDRGYVKMAIGRIGAQAAGRLKQVEPSGAFGRRHPEEDWKESFSSQI